MSPAILDALPEEDLVLLEVQADANNRGRGFVENTTSWSQLIPRWTTENGAQKCTKRSGKRLGLGRVWPFRRRAPAKPNPLMTW